MSQMGKQVLELKGYNVVKLRTQLQSQHSFSRLLPLDEISLLDLLRYFIGSRPLAGLFFISTDGNIFIVFSLFWLNLKMIYAA